MSNVININDHRSHLTITTHDKSVHVIPVSVFIDIASGKKSISDIDDYNAIIKVIVLEWLIYLGMEEGMIS